MNRSDVIERTGESDFGPKAGVIASVFMDERPNWWKIAVCARCSRRASGVSTDATMLYKISHEAKNSQADVPVCHQLELVVLGP